MGAVATTHCVGVGMSPTWLRAVVAGQHGWHPLPHWRSDKEDHHVGFLLGCGSALEEVRTTELWWCHCCHLTIFLQPSPWLSSLDGAVHTRVQLVPWLLFPAALTGSEDVLAVTVRLMKTGKYRINSVKGKEVLREMEIFSCKKCPSGMLKNVEIELGNVFYNHT